LVAAHGDLTMSVLLLRSGAKPLVFPALLILAWAAFSAAKPGSANSLLVSPAEFLSALAGDARSGFLPAAVAATLTRAIAGFVIGASIGLVVGIALGLFRPIRLVASPTIDSVRQIALFAWIPLLSAWLGNGEAMKITLISLGAFFPVALATAAACATVGSPYLEVGRTLELDRLTEIRKIILPAAAPAIVAGLELSLNIAWLGTIGAEYLIGTGYINGMGDGIGAYLAQAREFARMDRILVGFLSLALVGLALDRSVAWLSRRMFPWQTR
jgi:sulfonate transport system permease protein